MISVCCLTLAHVLGQGSVQLSAKETLGLDYWTTISFVMPTESMAPTLKRETNSQTRNVYTKESIGIESLSERYEVMAEKGSPLLVLIDKEYGPLRHWKETAKLLKQAKDNDFLIPISQLSDTMFSKLERYRRPIGNPEQAKTLVTAWQTATAVIDGKSIHIELQSSASKSSWEKLSQVPISEGRESSRKVLKDVVPPVDTSYRVKPGRYGDEVEIAKRLQELLERESRTLESVIGECLPKGIGQKKEMRLDDLSGEQKAQLVEQLKREARAGNLTDLQVGLYLSSNPVVQITESVAMTVATGKDSASDIHLFDSYRRGKS